MKRYFAILMIMTVVVLTGCSSGGGLIPITDTMVNEAGEVVETTSGYTRDASVAKEHEVHETLRNRDAMIAKAQKNSGFKMDWKVAEQTTEVNVPGMDSPIVVRQKLNLPDVTYTPQADFNQKLPLEPSRHPVWVSVDNAVDKITGLGEKFLYLDFGKYVADRVQSTTYGGDYNFQTQTAEPYVVNPVTQ